MRALYYQCLSGISGDMNLGALVDAGVPFDYLQQQLAQLPLADEFELLATGDKRRGISGTRITVDVKPGVPKPHRHLSTINQLIDAAGLTPNITALAKAIFQEIAVAEAKVHAIDIERVHFHEVGATDSIVDIVGAAICIDYLKVDRIYCDHIELGSGTVRCEHGVMPVPAPATAELVASMPCHHGGVRGEATTPTGAAILKALVDEFAPPPSFAAERWGYGVGQKDFEIANVLRVGLGEVPTTAHTEPTRYLQEHNQELECTLDDMPAEAFEPLLQALQNLRVLDYYLTPVQMKKARPGTKLTVLCHDAQLDEVATCVFNLTTTLGVRTRRVEKLMLPRETRRMATRHGDVDVKVARSPDGALRFKPEHDQVLALSRGPEHYRRVQADVYADLLRALHEDDPINGTPESD